jgi:hypothetical protein
MRKYLLSCLILFFRIFVFSQSTVGLIQHDSGALDDGYVLFTPNRSTDTYLIDKCGRQVHKWSSQYQPGQSVYLLPNGTLLRTGKLVNSGFNAGGSGGVVEMIDWNDNLIWSYVAADADHCQHHDVKALPNGNVLVISWDSRSINESILNGRNPDLLGTSLWSEEVLEIQPDGLNGGIVVWEWHAWDHLIQDFDSSQLNFGVVADHPELLNVNYGAVAGAQDWLHINSIDYNESLDQILLSSHNMNEIWIIDHSTSSAEAASHLGGNSGNGGDFLYRWGNPEAYNNGAPQNEKFWGQHNAHWITSGLPYAGKIIVFNNGFGRPGGNYSTIEILDPPANGFNYESTLPYGPADASVIYNEGNPNAFYAMNISGADILPNGNIMMCNGPSGNFIEVDLNENMVWNYISPVNNNGIINQGTTPTNNSVFRCVFYPSDYSGFNGQDLSAGNIIEDANTLSDQCVLNIGLEDIQSSEEVVIFPNPANEILNIDLSNGELQNATVELLDVSGRWIKTFQVKGNGQVIRMDLTSCLRGIYLLKVSSNNFVRAFRLEVGE